jgi:hypothetical protein
LNATDLDDPEWQIGVNVNVDDGTGTNTKVKASKFFIEGIPTQIDGDTLKKQITQDNLNPKIKAALTPTVSCVKYDDPTTSQVTTRIITLFDIPYNSDPDSEENVTICHLHFGQQTTTAPTGCTVEDVDDVNLGTLKVRHYHKVKRKNHRFTYHVAVFK